jgi:hypothetical protein
MKNKILLFAACTALLCVSGGTIVAKIVYVNEDYVELRPDKGGWSEPILTLHKGASMDVLEGDGDDSTSYYKVRATDNGGNSIEGYILKSLVSDTKPDEGAWSQQPGYYGNVEASREGETAAAKGLDLSPAAQAYLGSNPGNPAALRKMDMDRRAITPNDMQDFMRGGNIGVYQPRTRQGGAK